MYIFALDPFMTKTIYLDMDGVIVNLDGVLHKKLGHAWELPSQEMWDLIRKKAPTLFIDADPMDDARHLVDVLLKFIKSYNVNLEILTAVPSMVSFDGAPDQKQEWLRTHFPELTEYKFNIGPHAKDKQTFCKPGDVLIDDSHMNIDQWRSRGGVGILHTNTVKTLDTLWWYLNYDVVFDNPDDPL